MIELESPLGACCNEFTVATADASVLAGFNHNYGLPVCRAAQALESPAAGIVGQPQQE